MNKLHQTEQQIEILRLRMYECYQENALSEELVKLSQELDQLLNKLRSLSN